jgi:serine/threonine protein kinase
MDQTSEPLPENVPSAFGDYKVSSYISHGSYGHVFRVFRNNDVEFALKWLRSDAEQQGAYRFENEIWALDKLDHRAIPKLIDRGEHDGRPYFVMSLANGTSLRSIYNEQFKQSGASASLWVLAIAVEVLDALAHMHSRGVFHRDVKDDNIIVTDSLSQISLIDLGFCRREPQPSSDFASFWNVGAARYSPPSKLIDPSSPHETHDIFAVGVVAYLLLTNRYPWDVEPGESFGKLRELMRRTRPTLVHEINGLVDRRISVLIDRLLVIGDDERPSAVAARDEIVELQGILAQEGPTPLLTYGRATRYPHVARDAIHGDIRLTDYEW